MKTKEITVGMSFETWSGLSGKIISKPKKLLCGVKFTDGTEDSINLEQIHLISTGISWEPIDFTEAESRTIKEYLS